ncbi:MAG: Gfo/Idh/MocA family oxidoreductase [Muribaculaceae bacterium]|nr:Gfo/Idh/MocA family oxidoreductase [Muribaculaceae bacterium]
MKKLTAILATALIAVSASAQALSPSTTWHWDKGTIVIDTPARPAGQTHAVGLATEPLPVVRVGFVGLGMRGPSAVNRFCHIPGVSIVALCDYDEASAEASQRFLRKAGLPPAAVYSGEEGYRELCERPDIDLVYIATDWDHHYPVARAALESGKHAAVEVPSAMNLEQCWGLIDLSERTRRHCMILENCCYDYYELNALAMAQAGVFGELLRAEGAYIHNLDPYWDAYWKSPADPDSLGWRLKYNMENRGDLYATHGLGPVAQCMDIHRGDRFTTLVAMDTKSVLGREHVEKRTGRPCPDFRNGDHTTTLMRTDAGKVVEIQHNVMTPQPYNRLFKLTGTKGYATKYPDEKIALDKGQLIASGVTPKMDDLSSHGFLPEAEYKALVDRYRHPIIERYGELGREMGHGGMDFMMDSRLVYCLRHGLPLDMDVYDLAEWCSLAELGSLSADNGSAAVAFPDFTRGHWADIKGYRHAYAAPEAEEEADRAAKAYTEAAVADCSARKLWEAYDKALAKKGRRAANAIADKARR